MKIFKWNLIDDYDKMCLQNGLVREYKTKLEMLEKQDFIKTMKLTEAEKEIEKLNDIIEKAKEYIDKHLKEHIIEDQPDEQSIFYDEKGYYIPNAKEQLLNILNGKDN